MLPQESGLGSGMTCWRRLRDWQQAGVWERLQHELLNRFRDTDRIDWSRAAMDASLVPAKNGALRPG
jgi:transposase